MSPDGLTYTFHLRQGVKFHDGTPFTAHDVIATFERRRNPPSGVVSIRQELFKPIEKMEAPDPYTVRFTLSAPRGYFLEAVATGWSVIYSKKSLQDNKSDLRRIPKLAWHRGISVCGLSGRRKVGTRAQSRLLGSEHSVRRPRGTSGGARSEGPGHRGARRPGGFC